MLKLFRFIKATEEFNSFERAVPAPYVRKSFISDCEAVAKLKIAVCGFYELFFNGKKITKGFLAPYISNTDDYIYYDEYEITLQKGENVLAFLLGNGFQNNPGGYIWDFDKAPFRSAPKLAVILSYKNEKGEEITVESDESFKTHPSAIISDDYRFGENYDANCEIVNWNGNDFDDSLWKNMLLTEPPKGEIKLCEAEPIVSKTELCPVNIFKEDDGYVYDFGTSNAGVCRMCINGIKGKKIELQHGDLLKDGKFHFANIWFVRDFWERDKEIIHKDTYICKGEENEIYMPSFTYHGFRYVKVVGITPEQATKELLTFVVFHSDLKSRGDFSCSNETVNKLQEMTRRSDLSNFHYFPTDCPHREKNGWTADAALSCEQMTLNFNPEKSYREWLNNVRKAQTEKGSLPGIVPTGGWGFEWGNGPAWDCALIYLPYYTYIYRGETDMINESADSFIKYLKYLECNKDDKGLLCFGLGDWCHVGYPEGMSPKAPLVVTDTIISMDIANKIAFMLDAVGLKNQSDYAKNQYNSYRKAIRDNLIDYSTMTVLGNCQSSQAMGLYYNIFDAKEKPAAVDVLLKLIHETDDHIDVGVLGGKVLFHVLSEYGYTDLAFKMITRPDYPSYGNWVERGATTLWEVFDRNFVGSPNHHFWGDISAWFIKNLAGIKYNPTGCDITQVTVEPRFVKSLQNAEGYYESKYGRICSSWNRENENIVLTLIIPDSVRATVILNDEYTFEDRESSKILKSGKYVLIHQ